MSKRPTQIKRAKRIRKAFRRSLPRYINLVEYLTDRRLASSKRVARQMLLDGKVRVGSHKVGRIEVEILGQKQWAVDPYVPAEKRNEILVVLVVQ